jgi:hypothetical protein
MRLAQRGVAYGEAQPDIGTHPTADNAAIIRETPCL